MSGNSPSINRHKLDFEIGSHKFLRDDVMVNCVDCVFSCCNQLASFSDVKVEHVLFAGAIRHVVKEHGFFISLDLDEIG